MVGIHATVGKRAKRMPDITVETTWVGEWWVRGWRNDSGGLNVIARIVLL